MKWGVAGHGDIVSRRVVPALRALGEEPLRLWGRDPRRAADAAARLGIACSGSDPEALLDGVAAVYVATPVVLHVPLARRALASGVPVLVEKPLAGALSPGAGELVTNGVCAGVGYYRRLAPAVRRLRRLLADWSPDRIEVEFRCAFEPSPDHPMRWRTDPAVSGGGVLADAGSHRLDLLLMLFGLPGEVEARLGRRFPAGAERRAEVALRWPSGLRAHCLMEWSEGPPVDRVAFHGGGRSMTLDPLDSGRLCLAGPEGRRQEVLEPAANPHVPLIADFVAALAGGRPPVCSVAEAMLVDDLILAAARSDALGGRPVSPGE